MVLCCCSCITNEKLFNSFNIVYFTKVQKRLKIVSFCYFLKPNSLTIARYLKTSILVK